MPAEAPVQLIRHVHSQYYVSPSGSDPIIFGAMNILIALIIALYLFGVFKQIGKSHIWVAQVDPEGYWQPNVNVVLPIFATAHGIVLSVALGLMHLNFGGPVGPWTISFGSASFFLLHYLNWSKTWVTLYAMPNNMEGLHLAHPRARLSTRFASPYLFNTLVLLGYAAPLLIGVPLMIFQHRSIDEAHQNYRKFLKAIQLLGERVPKNASLTTWLLNPIIAPEIENLKNSGDQTHHYGKLLATVLIAVHSTSVLFLLWAKQAILRTLFKQVKINRRCIWNRRQVLGLELASAKSLESKEESCPEKSQSASLDCPAESFTITFKSGNTREPPKRESFLSSIDWKVFTPCLRPGTEVGAELWKSDLMRHLDDKDQALQSNLEVQYFALRQYTANTMWQALLICVISGGYITLGLSYVFNWQGAPFRISYPQLCLDQLKYAGIIWTVGGFLLATLTAIVASSALPNAASQQTVTSISLERPDSLRLFKKQL
ncbi:hypothetical protein PCANC_02234 [Puccinia coronata f. sp. avenae]|uniref:Uncharacterized protein n=1 Tax=Puccinia coronata f. sp. avenae TaxID=200324 RepID=A0A2N5W0Z8_9BASI|nr:hypothetical protein PCASD_12440 [Puccinia coronata f. sp. avenae]PLW55924.1 hypothetical protein PCANC_02234 [Puccinia coronata f. sp. avenae]